MLHTDSSISIIASHRASADHFATLIDNLPREKKEAIRIFAAGPALKKFQERGVAVANPFSIDNLSSDDENQLADQIAKTCNVGSIVITDVGHAFDIKMQKALSKCSVTRFAYYDNPEPYVPGGYSTIAVDVMLAAQGILFANFNLASSPIYREKNKIIDLSGRRLVGLGYYPVKQAEKIAERRKAEHDVMRAQLFAKSNIIERNQNVLVYFGGNNEEYFNRAFPAFLSILSKSMANSDLSNLVIVLQQHPDAKVKNLDALMVSSWMKENDNVKAPKMIISNSTSDEAQVVADAALYYQTSMGPQFVLAGIPTAQIGHDTYDDILVQNHLIPSMTDESQFKRFIEDFKNSPKDAAQKERIYKGLGIRPDCFELFDKFLNVK